ncbi:hypothetical protein [uncultured Duncaniella sp.]|uniref:hypothetical protein n=1 Tax=uncultured Duncaniella sp. TaxID=2768039 RepID=UPI0025AA24AF|nr:hypothetical protein [uncultured Duncaniella sp.]
MTSVYPLSKHEKTQNCILTLTENDCEQSSTDLHVEDRNPLELIITKASLRDDGKIAIKGYCYYSGEGYE